MNDLTRSLCSSIQLPQCLGCCWCTTDSWDFCSQVAYDILCVSVPMRNKRKRIYPDLTSIFPRTPRDTTDHRCALGVCPTIPIPRPNPPKPKATLIASQPAIHSCHPFMPFMSAKHSTTQQHASNGTPRFPIPRSPAAVAVDHHSLHDGKRHHSRHRRGHHSPPD
jgi:hypothetical protein